MNSTWKDHVQWAQEITVYGAAEKLGWSWAVTAGDQNTVMVLLHKCPFLFNYFLLLLMILPKSILNFLVPRGTGQALAGHWGTLTEAQGAPPTLTGPGLGWTLPPLPGFLQGSRLLQNLANILLQASQSFRGKDSFPFAFVCFSSNSSHCQSLRGEVFLSGHL